MRVSCVTLLLVVEVVVLRGPLVPLLDGVREVSTGSGGGVGTGASTGSGLDMVRRGESGPVAVAMNCSGRMSPVSLFPADTGTEADAEGITGTDGTGMLLKNAPMSLELVDLLFTDDRVG